MEDLIGVLCFASIVLPVVAVVGHLLWIGAAAVLRAMAGGAAPDAKSGPRCATCGGRISHETGRCLLCGRSKFGAQPRSAELNHEQLLQELTRLRLGGAMSAEVYEKLLQLLDQKDERPASRPDPSSAPAGRRQPLHEQGERPAAAAATGTPFGAGPAAPRPAAATPTPPRLAPRPVRPAEPEIIQAEVFDAIVVESGGAPPVTAAPPKKPHPLDADAPLPAATTAARQHLAEILQSFMAEKNIRWGELVSGLLIVGSAVGLVISLRPKLDAIPYFSALMFLLVTLAIYGAGMYTLRRWNLRATSHGVLTISLLLAPLNFMAAIMLSGNQRQDVPLPLFLLAITIGMLCCGWITFSAGRALLGRAWWRLTCAVLAASAGQIVVDKCAAWGNSLLGVSALAALPMGGYLAATLSQAHQAIAHRRLSGKRSIRILLTLGVSTFALLVPLALLIASKAIEKPLARLAPSLSLLGAAVLCTGLLLHGRVLSRTLAAFRTTGTALAVGGGLLLIGTVLLAWPEPQLLLAVGLTNTVILVVVAVLGRLPLLHTAACGCCTLAYLVGFHLCLGNWNPAAQNLGTQWLQLFCLGRSGAALTALAGMLAGVAWGLNRRQRLAEAESYWLGCGGVAALSVLIAAWAGFGPGGDRAWATPLFALYTGLALAAAVRLSVQKNRFSQFASRLTYTSLGLLLATLVHAFWLNEYCQNWLTALHLLPPRPILTSLLVTANFAALCGLFFARRELGAATPGRTQPRWSGLIQPCVASALVLTTVALPAALAVQDQAFGLHGFYLLTMASVWLMATVLERQAWTLVGFKVLATLAIGFFTAATCYSADNSQWWASATHLQTQLAVLAVWCLLWIGVRFGAARYAPRDVADWIARLDAAAVEYLLLGGLVIVLLLHGWTACWPGVAAELGFTPRLDANTPQLACGPRAWLALTLILVTVLGALWEQVRRQAAPESRRTSEQAALERALWIGLWLIWAAIPLVASAPWGQACATASALRWWFAGYALATSSLIWCRRPILAWLGQTLPWPQGAAGGVSLAAPAATASAVGPPTSNGMVRILRETGLWIGMLPVLLFTTIMVLRAIQGLPVGKPDPDSLFGHLGKTLSYGIPLLAVVVVLLGHAVREGLPGYALFSSIVFQYTLTLAHALHGKVNAPGFGAELLQWNANGLAGFTLVWLALERWLQPKSEPGGPGTNPAVEPRAATAGIRPGLIPLLVQVTAMISAVAGLTGWAALAVFLTPSQVSPHEQPLGGLLSYLAFGLALVAGGWLIHRRPLGLVVGLQAEMPAGFAQLAQLAAGAVAAVVALVAMTVDPLDNARHWLAYHVLMYGWLLVAAGAASVAWSRLEVWRAVKVLGGLVTLLAIRGCLHDAHPWAPWWSLGAAAGTALLATAGAFRQRRQGWAYTAVLLAMLATSCYWFGPWLGRWPRTGFLSAVDLMLANLLTATVGGCMWLAVEIWFQRTRPEQTFAPNSRVGRVHSVIAALALVSSALLLMLIFVGGCLERGLRGTGSLGVGLLPCALLVGALGLLLVARIWDRRATSAMPGLYVWGVLVLTLILDRLHLHLDRAFFAVGLATAGYVTLTSLLWQRGLWWVWLGHRWGVAEPVAGLKRTARWLPIVNFLAANLALLSGLIVVLTFPDRWIRISSGFIPALLAVGVGALAQKERRTLFQFGSLLMTGAAVVYLSWADIEPGWGSGLGLERGIRLLIDLSALTFFYGLFVRRWVGLESDWLAPVRRITATFGGGALVTLLLVLVGEGLAFQPGVGVPIGSAQVAAVAIVLVGLIAGLLSIALWPGRDPLALSETGRVGYVYAAELVATLLFVHVYLCLPWLFHGYLRAYWPYIVMAIAFTGAGVGEVCQRRNVRVLAEPLSRTGFFLPLLPVLGVWFVAAERTNYSTLLFVVGLLYLLVSFYRRSIVSGVAAAVAGNGALWSWLHQSEFLFTDHPQMWLIPPAVAALIAGQLNRRRLPAAQLTGLRLASMLVIYVSSTSEIFLREVGTTLWPPMILATLSVAGVLLGVALRVRSFLYLGTSFVLLSVVSMVWHAAHNLGSWPWWAFAMSMGIGIMVLFGVFEKKRPELAIWIERLRHWDG